MIPIFLDTWQIDVRAEIYESIGLYVRISFTDERKLGDSRYRDIAMQRVTWSCYHRSVNIATMFRPSARVVEKQRDILLFHLSLYPRLCNDCS